jgi:hypothetical protein
LSGISIAVTHHASSETPFFFMRSTNKDSATPWVAGAIGGSGGSENCRWPVPVEATPAATVAAAPMEKKSETLETLDNDEELAQLSTDDEAKFWELAGKMFSSDGSELTKSWFIWFVVELPGAAADADDEADDSEAMF